MRLPNREPEMATILVVEDEKPIREFLAQALEENGHRVLQAFNGHHALNLLATNPANRPALVISDVMMPLLDGRALSRILKQDPATASIPIVIMSAAPPRLNQTDWADAIIAKPFDLDALDQLVSRLVSDSHQDTVG